MTATIDGSPILSATIRMPAVGAWHLDIEARRDTALAGTVTASIDGIAFVATVIRAGLSGSRSRAKLVGGKGRLSRDLGAKQYVGPTVGQVVADILSEAGETVSATVDAATKAHALPSWERAKGLAGHALTAVLAKAGAVWRVERGGAVWYGPQTWAAQDVDHVVIDEDWVAGVIEIAPEAPDLLPGVTFRGQRIESVVHRIGPSSLRTEARLTRGGSMLERFLEGVLRKIDYSRLWPATVTKQNADGTLELVPDDDRIRGTGLDKVPIRYGQPGHKLEVRTGDRVLVGFAAGDASRPYVAGWEQGAGKIRIGQVLLVQAALTPFQLVPPPTVPGSAFFPAGAAGDAAAAAAKLAATTAGFNAFLLPIESDVWDDKP